MQSGTRAHDQGVYLSKDTLGTRRRKALLFLIKHPELDEDEFTGELIFHLAGQGMIKAAIHERPREIQDVAA